MDAHDNSTCACVYAALVSVTTLHQGIDELAARAGKGGRGPNRTSAPAPAKPAPMVSYATKPKAERNEGEAAFSSSFARSKIYVSFACHLVHTKAAATTKARHDVACKHCPALVSCGCPCVVWYGFPFPCFARPGSHLNRVLRHNSEEAPPPKTSTFEPRCVCLSASCHY